MLDIKKIVDDPEEVKKNIAKRGFDSSMLDTVLDLNNKRKQLTTSVEGIRAELNSTSKEIGKLKKAGQDASEVMKKSLGAQGF
jgi:seryl-tRNA synthetase